MNLPQELKVELIAHRQEFENELHNILSYWMKHAPDRSGSGFYGAVDLNNQPVMDAPRSCVLTARILYTFSSASMNFPGRGYEKMAQRALDTLLTHFQDHAHQGFFMEISSDNSPLNPVKHTYVQAFAIYALAKYYEVFQEEKILILLRDFFTFLDAQAKDPEAIGYLEGFTREWTLLDENRMADENDPKTMNTHLHLLEAYAALYKVWPDLAVRKRLTELCDLFQESIIRRDGHLGIFFDQEFVETKASRAICSFGHDIEASWLIREAHEILGDQMRADVVEPQLIQMAKNVFREGVDQDGGLFLESTRFGSHVRTNKHWWLQAELLVGEMNAFQETGTIQYWKLLKRTWRFIDQNLIDHKKGEWYTKLNRLGKPYLDEPADDPSPYYRNDWKIDPWKCPYHNGRAMIELINRIDNILQK